MPGTPAASEQPKDSQLQPSPQALGKPDAIRRACVLTWRPEEEGQVHGQEQAFPCGYTATLSVVEKQGLVEMKSEAVFVHSDEGLQRGFFVNTLHRVPY